MFNNCACAGSDIINELRPHDIALHYFDSPGRAEPVRLAFALGGVPFKDIRISIEEWMSTVKHTMATKQIPMLQVDGAEYYESLALLAYAGSRANLIPEDPIELMEVWQLILCTESVATSFKKLRMMTSETSANVIKNEKENVPRAWALIEEMVKSSISENGFCVGGKISIADLVVSSRYDAYLTNPVVTQLGTDMTVYNEVNFCYKAVRSNPGVEAYYEHKRDE